GPPVGWHGIGHGRRTPLSPSRVFQSRWMDLRPALPKRTHALLAACLSRAVLRPTEQVTLVLPGSSVVVIRLLQEPFRTALDRLKRAQARDTRTRVRRTVPFGTRSRRTRDHHFPRMPCPADSVLRHCSAPSAQHS